MGMSVSVKFKMAKMHVSVKFETAKMHVSVKFKTIKFYGVYSVADFFSR